MIRFIKDMRSLYFAVKTEKIKPPKPIPAVINITGKINKAKLKLKLTSPIMRQIYRPQRAKANSH
jgi:hypothetical protein